MKDWWPAVTRREIEWHVSRRAALDAEAIAIRTESPRHNKMIPGVSPGLLRAEPADGRMLELLRSDHYERVTEILRVGETDLSAAWSMATDYAAETERRRGTCADLRAAAALQLMRQENLSIGGLAKVIGVSKGRTQRMLMRAEQGSDDE